MKSRKKKARRKVRWKNEKMKDVWMKENKESR